MRAVSLDALIPPMLAGAKTAGASLPVGGLGLPKDALGRSMALLGATDPADGLWQARAAKVDRRPAAGRQKTLGPGRRKGRRGATDSTSPGTRETDDENAQGASAGGQSELAAQLDTGRER